MSPAFHGSLHFDCPAIQLAVLSSGEVGKPPHKGGRMRPPGRVMFFAPDLCFAAVDSEPQRLALETEPMERCGPMGVQAPNPLHPQ